MASQALVIEISADQKDLAKALEQAQKDIKNFGVKLGQEGKDVGSNFVGGFAGGARSQLRLVTEQFREISTTAQGGFAAVGESFLTKVVNPVTIGAAAIGASIFAAFQFAKIGEQNEKIGKTFTRFATDAGLDADRLKAKIAGIAEGFVDLEDVLPRAGEAVLNLGKNAQRLPEILDLARRIGTQTGRDITQVFEELTKGIENQNIKLLRNNSIRLDGEKVLADYAKEQGKTVAQLSEAAKQQAILNAALEQGNQKFKETGAQAAPIEGGIKKLSLAFDDLKDAIGAVVNSKLGEFFASTISGTANAIKTVASAFDKLKGGPSTIAEDISTVENQLRRLNELKLSNLNTNQYDAQITDLKTKLESLKTVQSSIDQANVERDKQAAERAKLTPSEITGGETQAQIQAKIEQERVKQAEIAAIRAEADQTELQAAQDHQLALAAIEAEGNTNTVAFRDAQLNATLEKNQAEFDSALIKNSKIADNDKLAAANLVALKKKEATDQKVLDNQKVTEAKLVADAKRKIEQDLFAAAFTFAEGNAEATKALNIAQAIRNTYQGASLALATYPPPFGGIAAASTVALGLAQVAKITAANTGALVTGGQPGQDTNPFLLSKGEIVAPAKSFDEVVEGTARQRGFVKSGEGTDGLLRELIDKVGGNNVSITVNTDVIADDNGINTLVQKIRDAIDFNAAPSLG
jgi:hypothetical protein